MTVSDPATPTRSLQVWGEVVNTSTDGAVNQIEELAQRSFGRPYPWFGGSDEVRVKWPAAPPDRPRGPRESSHLACGVRRSGWLQ
ncbi:hypothetical protein ACFYYB_26915 [Streptomyces sp. NPDC002886]|uniref:hypothetical protein n=1 Tax=Streptomyces sp. NPDC002886 TaxID=3364667 RepID=UPI00369C3F22